MEMMGGLGWILYLRLFSSLIGKPFIHSSVKQPNNQAGCCFFSNMYSILTQQAFPLQQSPFLLCKYATMMKHLGAFILNTNFLLEFPLFRWGCEIYGTVSQVRNARLAMRAQQVAPSQPSASLALFSLCPDSPHVTAAHGVMKIKHLYSNVHTQPYALCVVSVNCVVLLCPGFYCVEGSSAPSPCPLGTIGLSAGRMSSADCSPCPSGFFCNGSALTEPNGPCSPGRIVWEY